MPWTTVLGPLGEDVEVFTVEGSDPNIPPDVRRAHLQERVVEMMERQQKAAHRLFELLIVDGIEHQIQLEDIEALCATEKTPRGRSAMLMRKVIIEFLLVLQKERLEAESAHAQGALSLGG